MFALVGAMLLDQRDEFMVVGERARTASSTRSSAV